MRQLVQFLVDLIHGDASINLPTDINTCDEYDTFLKAESVNLRDFIVFKDIPLSLRNYFAFIIQETNVDGLFSQEWLALAVDILYLMSNIESSPTMQVFAGYCCIYMLECFEETSDALCSRLSSAIFHAYEICLSSTW